ncbi:MAG: hypothetical protein JKX96_07745 [Acinetobacter sp.]|nr:hypothetical protein [Acinetobacter sp.]
MPETDNILFQHAQRLDRFEDQLGEISKAIVQMAKIQERVSILIDQNSALVEKDESLQIRINSLEIQAAVQKKSMSVFERIAWIVITGVVSGVTWVVKG